MIFGGVMDTVAGVVAPVGTVLADAPWWVSAGVFALALSHRVLPRDSKDLLELWLRLLPARNEGDEEKEDDEEKDNNEEDDDDEGEEDQEDE